jgi:hypothetical protein
MTREASAWYQSPQRLVQTVLREIDVVDYDPGDVVAYLRRANASGLVINAGGIFDFFRNPLPMANMNLLMGGRDVLGEIAAACHRAGFRVIARVDFRGVEEARYATHPDWFAVGPKGGPVVAPHNSIALRVPCYNGYYRNEHAVRFVQHLLHVYPIDGIWHNAVLISTRCYCDRCRKSFGDLTGLDLDVARESDPVYERHYQHWLNRCARDNLDRMRRAVKGSGDDKAYVAEVFGMFDVDRPKRTGVDLYEASDYFDFLVSVGFLTENRSEPALEPLSYPSSLVRFLRSLAPEKQPVLLFGTNGTAYRYVADPPADLRVWLWENVSAGGGFWNCLFNGMHPGRTHDRRNANLAVETYAYLARHERLIGNALPVAEVRILYSKPTKDRFGSDNPDLDRAVQEVRGFERALVSGHIQYGFFTDRDLDAGKAVDARVLVLPNVACMSGHQCEEIRRYVASGGSLIATFQTSLFDENGMARGDFGLSDVLGVSVREPEVDTSFDRYQFLVEPDHEILTPFAQTELLAMAGRSCHVVPHSGTTVVTTITRQIRNQPPELAWTEDLSNGFPGICSSRYGKGIVVYISYTIGRLVSVGLHPDFAELVRAAIDLASGGGFTILAEAPATVHLTVLERRGHLILNLVNHCVGERRPVEALVPVHGIRAIVRRVGTRLLEHRILHGNGEIRVEERADGIVTTVSTLTDFASILLVLGTSE